MKNEEELNALGREVGAGEEVRTGYVRAEVELIVRDLNGGLGLELSRAKAKKKKKSKYNWLLGSRYLAGDMHTFFSGSKALQDTANEMCC